MTIFAGGGRARTLDFETGDVGYVLKTLPHYIENTGNTDLTFLEMFKSDHFQDLSTCGMADSHAPGAGNGSPQYRQSHIERHSKAGAHCSPGLIAPS